MNKTEPYTTPLAEGCKICGRVAWGDIQRVGFGKWRHDECAIGSEAYKLYYATRPASEKAVLKEFFCRDQSTSGMEERNETATNDQG